MDTIEGISSSIYNEIKQKHLDMLAAARFMGILVPSYEPATGIYSICVTGKMWNSSRDDTWSKNWQKVLHELHLPHKETLRRQYEFEYSFEEQQRCSKETSSATLICNLSSGSKLYLSSFDGVRAFSLGSECVIIGLDEEFGETLDNVNTGGKFIVPLKDSLPFTTDFPMSMDTFTKFIKALGVAIISVQSRKTIIVNCQRGESRSALFVCCLLICLNKLGLTHPRMIDGSSWKQIACNVYNFVGEKRHIVQISDLYIGFYWLISEYLSIYANRIASATESCFLEQ